MKSIIAGFGFSGVLSVIGCAGPGPPAPFETTRVVPVTLRVGSVTEVEVTREVPVTVPVEVTRKAPVTRLVTPVPQAGDQSGKPHDEVELRIIAINDFHGHIATSSDSFGGVGRADYLAANVAAARANAQNSVFVSAGDLIGASPLISALFHDEPTIEAMNLIGLEINAVGNHEFDEGFAELQRMQHGGPHPVNADLDGNPFAGADFQFLVANVIDENTGRVILPAYAVCGYQGISVAFIGMTLEGTPSIVARSGVAGLTFRDEAETVNALVRDLQERGIESIVVLLHEGGSSDGGQNDCGTGHANDEFVCEIDGKWVTMADTRGRLFTVIDAALDPDSRDLMVRSIENRPNSQAGVTPVAAVTALIERYEVLAAPRANAVLGAVIADITRQPNDAGESALGNLIADAHLPPPRGGCWRRSHRIHEPGWHPGRHSLQCIRRRGRRRADLRRSLRGPSLRKQPDHDVADWFSDRRTDRVPVRRPRGGHLESARGFRRVPIH